MDYLWQKRRLIALLLAFACIFALVFFLYHLPAEPLLYAAVLCLFVGCVLFFAGFVAFVRRRRFLFRVFSNVREEVLSLPEPSDALEEDYQSLLRAVCMDRAELAAAAETQRQELLDYYTLWLHQIKTPIAAMQLLLTQSPPDGEAVSAELLKIETYASMVLTYLRLDSDYTDFVLRRCELDDIVRAALRKFARLFILKKITLRFTETGRAVLTDEKWLGFVVEQVLLNALKYTPAGGTIRIFGSGDALMIADNGIGIQPEDLPRIFEKGFTGYNGREESKSTGLGLYLSKRIFRRLGHTIEVVARPGGGTEVRLTLQNGGRVLE
ncbi:MAG: sensor histidine kinase [Oscillospiraceae bacterium]|nr:sensor histidine kinase [Oscillospiraceae bacterium]